MLPSRFLPALAAVLALAACEGNSPRPGDEFVANRVVARVQKADSDQELKLDAPLMGLQVTSALDASRALTLVIGGDLFGGELNLDTLSSSPAPMLELLIPGPLAVRSYPVGPLDLTADEPPLLGESSAALATVVAPEPDGDDVDFFTSSGGSVEVVKADGAGGRLPGHLRARVQLELREFYFDRFPAGYGKQATGKGSLDGPLASMLASDADLAFTGAFSGRTPHELLGNVFGGAGGGEREWGFLVTGAGGGAAQLPAGELFVRLARIPGAGETLAFAPVPPNQLYRRGPAGADTLSVAFLQVVSQSRDTLSHHSSLYVSTAGQLRVEAATAEAIRGTLTLTLTEYDLAAGRATGRTVSATGRVGLSLQAAPGLFNRSPAAHSHRAARARFQAARPRMR